jgi:TRAP-type transport system periplasmic protein
MERRCLAKFLFIVACIALVSVMSGKPAAEAQAKKIVMKFGHIQTGDDAVHLSAVRFAELVAQKTAGQAEVQVFPNSQLGNAKSQVQAVAIGGQDFFMDGIGWYVDYDKDWTPLALGFAIRSRDEMLKVLDSDWGRELEARLLTKGIRVGAHNWWKGDRSLISRKPIRTVAELQNVKMRVPSKAFFLTWQALGAQPTVIAWGEVFTGLQQGVIDAAEAPVAELFTQKLYEPAPNITLTRHLVNIAALSVSEKQYATWPPNVQKAVLEAAREAGDIQYGIQLAREKDAMNKMKAAGTAFYEPNRDEWIVKVTSLPEKLEGQGDWGKGVWARIQATIKK